MYCHRLGVQLRRLGIESRVAVHSGWMPRVRPGLYEHEGVPVHVLEPVVVSRRREAAYSCTPDAIPGFSALLGELRPTIVHFHDFSPDGASILHLREAKMAGARIVMAYQSAGQTCLQRSLWFGGDPRTVCDGLIKQDRCTRCRVIGSGMPNAVASLAGRLSFLAVDAESDSRLARFLSASRMTAHFVRAWDECISLVDMFHTGAEWAADLLRRNGVPPEKVTQIRHGISEVGRRSARAPAAVVTVGMVGRCDPAKGQHILVEAVRRLGPAASVRVLLIGPDLQSEYGRKIAELIGDDPRFEVRPPVPPSALLDAMREFDVLAVPSLWMETGPQVVMDAYSVGVPVIGSRRGGIAELVRDGVDGLLFDAGDARDMSQRLALLLADRSTLDRLRAAIPAPRHIEIVAQEILRLYADAGVDLQPGVHAAG